MATSRLSLLAMKDDGGKKKSKAERKAAKTMSPSTTMCEESTTMFSFRNPICETR